MKLLSTLALILALSSASYSEVCHTYFTDIQTIVEGMNWKVTSAKDGKHNKNSKHYIGKAVDVSVRGKSELDIAILFTTLESMGYIVKDERVRPKGQKVWGGAHIHIGIPYCK